MAGTVGGAAAQRAFANPRDLIRLSDGLTFEQGAALPLNYRTAILGLEVRGRMRAGESVLVHGAAGRDWYRRDPGRAGGWVPCHRRSLV